MAIYKLTAGETRLVKTSSRYVSVIELNGQMSIESPSYGLKPVRVKPGWQLDLEGIPEIYITNIDNADIDAELQDAGVRIFGGGGGAVSVTNKPVIQRIEEPVPFEANVTFNGGTVGIISPDRLETLADKSCAISTGTMLVDAGADRTALIIQNRSETDSLRIGGNQVSPSRGFILEPGSSMTLATKAPVFAYNDGAQAVTVTLTEM